MGTIAELQSKPDRSYPLLWLSNEGSSLDQNYKVDNIRLTMFGRVIAGEEGQDDDASEIEVLSDMQLILLDFLNYFHQQHGQEYVTDKAAQLEHFTERTNDRTAGYSCVLELKQFYDWNKCQIPESGASIPPSVDGLTLYDFCDQSTIDRLTPTQIACLEVEFGNCADGTVNITNTDSDPIATVTVASGGTEGYEIPNVDWTQSDGSPQSTPYGDNIVCTPCVPTPAPTVTIVASDSTPDYTDTITLTETTSGAPTINWTITDGVDIYEATGNPINLDTTQFGYGTLTIEAITIDTLVGRGTSTVTVSNTPEDIYDAFDAIASISDAVIKDAWVCAIKEWNMAGVWAKFHALGIMVGGTSSSHAVDLKTPSETITWYGSPTHNGKGVFMNGTSQYGISWYNPQTEAADKNSFGLVYCNIYGVVTNPVLMGEAQGANNAYLRQVQVSVIGDGSTAINDTSNDAGYSTIIRESSTYAFKLSDLSLEGDSTVANTQTTWAGAGIYIGRASSGSGGITLCQFAAITSGMSVSEAKMMVQIAKCANAKFR
jgi:hypothetical protein